MGQKNIQDLLGVILWQTGEVMLYYVSPNAGVAQLVEHLPSKQNVASSNLVSRF